eukprot:711540-Amphidinium_carterae.1
MNTTRVLLIGCDRMTGSTIPTGMTNCGYTKGNITACNCVSLRFKVGSPVAFGSLCNTGSA